MGQTKSNLHASCSGINFSFSAQRFLYLLPVQEVRIESELLTFLDLRQRRGSQKAIKPLMPFACRLLLSVMYILTAFVQRLPLTQDTEEKFRALKLHANNPRKQRELASRDIQSTPEFESKFPALYEDARVTQPSFMKKFYNPLHFGYVAWNDVPLNLRLKKPKGHFTRIYSVSDTPSKPGGIFTNYDLCTKHMTNNSYVWHRQFQGNENGMAQAILFTKCQYARLEDGAGEKTPLPIQLCTCIECARLPESDEVHAAPHVLFDGVPAYIQTHKNTDLHFPRCEHMLHRKCAIPYATRAAQNSSLSHMKNPKIYCCGIDGRNCGESSHLMLSDIHAMLTQDTDTSADAAGSSMTAGSGGKAKDQAAKNQKAATKSTAQKVSFALSSKQGECVFPQYLEFMQTLMQHPDADMVEMATAFTNRVNAARTHWNSMENKNKVLDSLKVDRDAFDVKLKELADAEAARVSAADQAEAHRAAAEALAVKKAEEEKKAARDEEIRLIYAMGGTLPGVDPPDMVDVEDDTQPYNAPSPVDLTSDAAGPSGSRAPLMKIKREQRDLEAGTEDSDSGEPREPDPRPQWSRNLESIQPPLPKIQKQAAPVVVYKYTVQVPEENVFPFGNCEKAPFECTDADQQCAFVRAVRGDLFATVPPEWQAEAVKKYKALHAQGSVPDAILDFRTFSRNKHFMFMWFADAFTQKEMLKPRTINNLKTRWMDFAFIDKYGKSVTKTAAHGGGSAAP
jgi:hypothetical protein